MRGVFYSVLPRNCPLLIYPIMSSIGLTGTSFPETDFVSVGVILNFILRFFN